MKTINTPATILCASKTNQNPAQEAVIHCADQPVILLRGRDVDQKIGSSRSTRYAKLDPNNAAYDPDFPIPVRIGANSVRWLESEVDAYIAALPRSKRVREGVGEMSGLEQVASANVAVETPRVLSDSPQATVPNTSSRHEGTRISTLNSITSFSQSQGG